VIRFKASDFFEGDSLGFRHVQWVNIKRDRKIPALFLVNASKRTVYRRRTTIINEKDGHVVTIIESPDDVTRIIPRDIPELFIIPVRSNRLKRRSIIFYFKIRFVFHPPSEIHLFHAAYNLIDYF